MNSYTIILTYKEGIYMSQVNSISEKTAIFDWIKKFDFDIIPNISLDIRDRLNIELSKEYNEPVLLKGLKNVFCATCTIKRNLFLINIIKTVT